jgi:AraC family transcriptional regulator, transcriptional activator FtrA
MPYIIQIMPNGKASLATPHSGPLVVALAYDQLCTFEFGVAYEVFGLSRPELGQGWYRFVVASAEPGPLMAAGGLKVVGNGGLELLDQADIIIVPGWRSIDAAVPAPLIAALKAAHQRGARIASLCSGVFVLAASGLLTGKRATTHWRYTAALKERFPEISVEPDVLYVDNGDVLTAAGSAAGIDLCLHIVRRDFGVETSTNVARRLVVPPHRDGGQAQFIRRPVQKSNESARLGNVLDWIEQHLTGTLAISTLAQIAGMSTRTFQRRFEESTGRSAGNYIIHLRIDRAQSLIEEQPQLPLNTVAELAGFGSIETMRHHFRKRALISPKAWRDRFVGRVV